MTHRDRAGDASGQRAGRREAVGPAGHRRGLPTPSGGSPARPERRFPKAFGRPMALRRGAWLAMSRIATPRAPGRKPWETVSKGHYQRSLALDPPAGMEGRDAAAQVSVADLAEASRLHHGGELVLGRKAADALGQVLVGGAVAGHERARTMTAIMEMAVHEPSGATH